MSIGTIILRLIIGGIELRWSLLKLRFILWWSGDGISPMTRQMAMREIEETREFMRGRW